MWSLLLRPYIPLSSATSTTSTTPAPNRSLLSTSAPTRRPSTPPITNMYGLRCRIYHLHRERLVYRAYHRCWQAPFGLNDAAFVASTGILKGAIVKADKAGDAVVNASRREDVYLDRPREELHVCELARSRDRSLLAPSRRRASLGSTLIMGCGKCKFTFFYLTSL
jgi:hypothetical protein